jgi:putative ABC transport system permease protein
MGDLEERWAARAARDGVRAARRWYWRQALAFLARAPSVHAARARPAGRNLAMGLASEIRLAGRTLRRRPGLALTATFVLALAVGANTTVFSVVDAVLIERLPYPEPSRLVMLWDVYPPESGLGDAMPITLEHYRAWSARTDLFSVVGAFESTRAAIVDGGLPERIDGALATANLLPMLGARPALGRLLLPGDEVLGAEPVVVLSHGLWSSRFGADRGIVGRAITINGVRTRVVGVVEEGFWFYDPYSATRSFTGRNAEAARLWQPLAEDPFGGETDYPRYRVIARLRDGVGVVAVATAADAFRTRLGPTASGDAAGVAVLPLTDQVVAEARPRLLGLAGAVALVLLIACVNLVSLLLVHLESRRSELALRAALGAGRGRLVRQLVVESSLLALGGGALGLLLSVPATRWLLGLVPRGLPLAHRVAMDVGVAMFGLAVALLSGAAIGVLAAWQVGRGRLAGGLAASRRAVSASRGRRRTHASLVTIEVALSLVLLISATLLLRSLAGLHGTDTGFRAQDVLTFEATLMTDADGAVDVAFLDRLTERLRELPGVSAVGTTSALPFSRWDQRARVEVGEGDPPWINQRLVSEGYFAALSLPLRAGRDFDTGDGPDSAPVAIVNQAFVDQWMAGVPNPIGRAVAVTRRGRVVRTIVGVVANVKHHQLFEPARPILYEPVRQSPVPFRHFAVRGADVDVRELVEPIRRAAAELDPAQSFGSFIPLEELVAQSIEEETFYTQVVAAFAATAVLLSLIGIYGVVSFTTRQRDREVGIRMALGASAPSVHRLVVRQGLEPVWIGLGLGWMGGLVTTGLLRSLLHGVPGHDPASYALATIAFAAVAAAACLIPARRALRLDPVEVLRGD